VSILRLGCFVIGFPSIVDLLSFIVNLLILIIMIITAIYSFMSRRGRGSIEAALREFHVYPRIISFPEKLSLERGWVTVTLFPKGLHQLPERLILDWRSLKQRVEANEVLASDLCFSPPVILRKNNLRIAILPGYRVTSRKYSGVIVTCIDTTRVHGVRTWNSLVYDRGHVRASLAYSGGSIEAIVEWNRIVTGESERINEEVKVEACTGVTGKILCDTIAELKEPGVVKTRSVYPEVSKLLILHKALREHKELVDTLRTLPEVFIPVEPQLRITVKRRFRKIASTP